MSIDANCIFIDWFYIHVLVACQSVTIRVIIYNILHVYMWNRHVFEFLYLYVTQWNFFIVDTIGTGHSVLIKVISEVVLYTKATFGSPESVLII